jgi:hypothetical protein
MSVGPKKKKKSIEKIWPRFKKPRTPPESRCATFSRNQFQLKISHFRWMQLLDAISFDFSGLECRRGRAENCRDKVQNFPRREGGRKNSIGTMWRTESDQFGIIPLDLIMRRIVNYSNYDFSYLQPAGVIYSRRLFTANKVPWNMKRAI